uniref:Putative Pyridine nucleotide-disulphide oxidoreductase n=1 Tax=uncultured marine microorganism HF4000_APKG8K5 TaxID=455555 RepID=B3TB64_9ZZZZ|nr:putative Pyridine nucleotide-disulphide oxidoreductase [uncultured marine microorganism HF4000_APKG8K5]
MTEISLGHGLTFEDLYDREGLQRIDDLFLDYLGAADGELRDRLAAARAAGGEMERLDESNLLVDVAPHLEDFIGGLFSIRPALRALAERDNELAPIQTCKRQFVQRRAAKTHSAEDAEKFDGPALGRELADKFGCAEGRFDQLTFAQHVLDWLEDEEANAEAIDMAEHYAAWAGHTQAGRERHGQDVLFHLVEKVDHFNLVPTSTEDANGVTALVQPPDKPLYRRDGFSLTDDGMDFIGAYDHANYCIICHDRGVDSCSTGLCDKKTGDFKDSPLGVSLVGCPLDERISEMHKVKVDGYTLAAMCIITVDNPMVAGTGHRICNECSKSCIFQKQEPVEIPQVETRIVKDVLALPWGFEIYSLLTRWNPLNFRQPVPLPETGYKILIVGLGPAGFTLGHYLMNAGHTVVAVDGLKIESVDPEISGVTASGERVAFKPIQDITELYENLDERAMAGFGGVAEYGITIRWDKNFLKVLRLLVERRSLFTMFGGVRFGGSITEESAFAMGFDHIAMCAGAGKPTYLSVPNGLARGVRAASDFLMALQLTGAAKKETIANLQLRLPAVIIGGGLTAIDSTTEAMAYYIRQVEKFREHYDILVKEKDEETVRGLYTEEEAEIADEFLAHAKAVAQERATAEKEGRQPHFVELLKQWGGVTIAYRRRLIDAPSYTLNHDEVKYAFREGIRFIELVSPLAVEVDEYGHAKALRLARQEIGEDGRAKPTGEEVTIPARAILVAAGTQPNTTLAREHPGFAEMDGKFYQTLDESGNPVKPQWSSKPDEVHALIKITEDNHSISFFGDLHPSFAGNVVSAMASAKKGFPVVQRALERNPPSAVEAQALVAELNQGLRATVKEVIRLTPTIVEVVVHAPFAARTFHPGQFYRLQNYENYALRANGTTLAMEGLALTGAWVDRDKGLVSVIILEMGGSSDLCIYLKPGEPVVLMGPTGSPTEMPKDETVMLVGGGLGNAVLFSIGQAMREAGSRVLYFGGYKKVIDRYHVEDILKAGDTIVWCCDEEPGFEPTRPQDKTVVGNIVEAIKAYGDGSLGEVDIPLGEVDRILAIGSDRMMNAVAKTRHGVLEEFFKPDHVALGSINSPMQCMMKEICAQCLQRHVDPETGKEKIVFSCFNQDQELDQVDFECLHQRLMQNGVHEKLTRQWISHCFEILKEGESARAAS